MDDRETFDRKCLEKHLELRVIVKARALAKEKGDTAAVEDFETQKRELVASSLDYIFEHLDYLDEPTREGFFECAAQLPIMLEKESNG